MDEKAEQVELRLLDEYKRKLQVDGEILPDPFSLSTGWKGEKLGMNLWPSIYVTDISQYLGCETPKNVIHRLLNEYKEGKAYRYFDSEWVKEVFVHEIRAKSDQCLLKAKVTPSQSINQKCYNVWIAVRKDSERGPGGEILSAYCTCTAGMLGTCNHVAGVLFRVEHAVKTGESKKTCTGKLSSWNVPKGKVNMKPTKACDSLWKKAHYGKKLCDVEKEKDKKALKKDFTPLTKKQDEDVKNGAEMRKKLHALLKEDIPDSCFAQLQEKKRIQPTKKDIPESLVEIAAGIKNTSREEAEKMFLDKINLTKEQCKNLKEETIEQSNSQCWRIQRRGRVTASVFQRVSSRVDTLRKKDNVDPSALVNTLIGRNKNMMTTAMKHGISLEPHAKKQYVSLMKKEHKKFKASDSGLSVSEEKPWLAASADLEVECVCCGEGLCEIKCPESIKDTVPSEENVCYLKLDEEGQLTLDEKHSYYFQIQGQLHILKRSYCDLFVYTYHGHQRVRILADSEFWVTLEGKLTWFWQKHVLPELLSTEESDNQENTSVTESVQTTDVTLHVNARSALNQISGNQKIVSQSEPPNKRRKVAKRMPIYLCGTCGCDCLDEPQTEADQSVNCDVCGVWVHYVCAGVTEKTLKTVDKWVCEKCE